MTQTRYHVKSRATRELSSSERAKLSIQPNRAAVPLQVRNIETAPGGVVRFAVQLPSGSIIPGFRAGDGGRWIAGPISERTADSRHNITAEIRRQLDPVFEAARR